MFRLFQGTNLTLIFALIIAITLIIVIVSNTAQIRTMLPPNIKWMWLVLGVVFIILVGSNQERRR